jgi:hypothetical protein
MAIKKDDSDCYAAAFAMLPVSHHVFSKMAADFLQALTANGVIF